MALDLPAASPSRGLLFPALAMSGPPRRLAPRDVSRRAEDHERTCPGPKIGGLVECEIADHDRERQARELEGRSQRGIRSNKPAHERQVPHKRAQAHADERQEE